MPGSGSTAMTLPQERDESATLDRILVVDDSALQRKILSASLRKWGFQVIEAPSGEDALELCRETQVDLILSDWMMPGMSGIEFCQAFRALGSEQYTYFILLTSKTDKGEIAEGLRIGADDFLSKPVSSEELRARITAGERILSIERELTKKNRLVTETLTEMRTLYEALDRDLGEARKLQLSLVPKGTVSYPEAAVSFLLQPSGHVGGDLVGQFPAGRDRVGLFSLDVSGHGIAAALVTARLAGWLKGSTPDQNVALAWEEGEIVMRPPEQVCGHLNILFNKEIDTEHYFTIALAEVDLVTGDVSLCQAGHPHPLIQRANSTLEYIGKGGLPIGLVDEADYTCVRDKLAPGDRMLLYSDGLTECPVPGGGMLDEDGLAMIMRRNRDVHGSQLLSAIAEELGHYVDHGDMPDDVSGVIIEFTGPGGNADCGPAG